MQKKPGLTLEDQPRALIGFSDTIIGSVSNTKPVNRLVTPPLTANIPELETTRENHPHLQPKTLENRQAAEDALSTKFF